ncbi:MAG: N-acetylmuramic acid 6-phosphate etherase [Brachybacterium sp.]|nr:N-acetylmuramic acid 6-phosphate etherase [Brachybacterium sp.]MDN6304083.1 N-acetylmuramic acid 6-phosphate etherase [Brachybacterium sp.]
MNAPNPPSPAPDDSVWRPLVDMASPTEDRNLRSLELDTLDAGPLVDLILSEDATVAAAVQAVGPQIAELVEDCVRAIAGGATVRYVGAGTSGRLGVLDAVELVPTYNADDTMFTAHLAGGEAAMMRAVEGAEDDEEAGARLIAQESGPGDVIIALAASGRTPFVGGALHEARARGLRTALISTNPFAGLAESADIAILPDVGSEVVTGSTRMKSATAQKLVLNALSTATMVRLGTTYSNLMINVRPTNHKLIARTVRMLVQGTGADAEVAAGVLQAADGDVRAALVALLAGSGIAPARAAAAAHPPNPFRSGDPAGIRAAVASLLTTS